MKEPLSGLEVTTPTDREILMTRAFDAPRPLVFKALTEPEWVRRWLLGPEGWSMVVCEIDLRVGGAYRYEWRHDDGGQMAMGGIYRQIVRPERLVTTERFDESWYRGEAVGTTTLVEKGGRTLLTLTVLYESEQIRDAVLRTPMETGVAVGYDRLEELLHHGRRVLDERAPL